MDYGLAEAIGVSNELTTRTLLILRISLRFFTNRRAARFALCSLEKTQSSISPYMCYELRALRYGWSVVVPWSRLFILHVYELRSPRYGLRASQG